MGRRKEAEFKDAERVRFIAPWGTADLYREVAELEGVGHDVDAWMRAVLHAEALRVLEAHGRSLKGRPEAHIRRPPRLQPRMTLPSESDT